MRAPSFRRRLALLFGLLWLLLLFLTLLLAERVAEARLKARLEAGLLKDLERVAEAYRKGQSGALITTGGIYLHLYDEGGRDLILTQPEHRLDPALLAQAGTDPQVFWSRGFLAGAIRTPYGILVLTQETEEVRSTLDLLRQTLLETFLLLFPLGLALVSLTARLAARPLLLAARAVGTRGPEDLRPIDLPLPQDEVGQMVERVNGLLRALSEAKERERAFLAEVSHELRTPLTVLLGHLDRLRRHPGDPKALEAAERTAKRMERLVGDLLDLARGEAERNLNPHIVDLLALAEEAAGEQGVRVLGERVEVLGDPDRLLQLLRNLIRNAVRAAGQEGVEVRVGREGPQAVLEVEDRGPGIPEELLPRLFQRFARGPGGGTGLGLAIAQAIARGHGGEIQVESRPGRTVFRVRLPLLEEEG